MEKIRPDIALLLGCIVEKPFRFWLVDKSEYGDENSAIKQALKMGLIEERKRDDKSDKGIFELDMVGPTGFTINISMWLSATDIGRSFWEQWKQYLPRPLESSS